MLTFLRLVETALARLLYFILRFRAGYMIEWVSVPPPCDDSVIKEVGKPARLLRGIRYARGKEGMPEPKCGNCGQGEAAHTIACPEEVPCHEDERKADEGEDHHCHEACAGQVQDVGCEKGC